jgi:hypothetical protein
VDDLPIMAAVAELVRLKSENTRMADWGASDDSPLGTVWSEYLDGWEVRRVECWDDHWLFIRDRRCLDTVRWGDEELARLTGLRGHRHTPAWRPC